MMSASMGASLDFRKLLVYPIPHRKLFLIEVLLRLTTCVEMLLVMAGGLAGLLLNPAAGGWARCRAWRWPRCCSWPSTCCWRRDCAACSSGCWRANGCGKRWCCSW